MARLLRNRKRYWMFGIPLILFLLIHLSTELTKPTSVKLINNGYSGVVVAIHPDEPENDTLIEKLVSMFNYASTYLYTATRQRAFFEEAIILIPDTWQDKSVYQSPRNATFDGADVIIAGRNPRFAPDPNSPPVPYTKHYEGCGKRAMYIHLTSAFLLNPDTESYYGNLGRVLVHEFAHYRWGLFDEYPGPVPEEQFYYSEAREVWEPIRCVSGYAATNVVYRDGRPDICNGNEKDGYEDGCVSIPNQDPGNVSASIMSGYTASEKIFSASGGSPAGGRVLLITDGLDHCEETTAQAAGQFIIDNIIIDAVAFSDIADEKLINLTESTGGRFFLQTDDPGSSGLHDAFVWTMQAGVKQSDRRIELIADSAYYEVGESRSYGVHVDETVGNRTTFAFAYFVDSITAAIEITITSPSEERFTSDYDGYVIDLEYNTISVVFDVAEPGSWSFEITNLHNAGHEIFATVYTFASQRGVDPIVARSYLSGSITNFAQGEPLIAFVEISQGLYPIINAVVFALIERPPDVDGRPHPPVEIKLLDNGAGADITKDDGIYSRYFTEFTGVGYYGIKITISSNENTVILNDGSIPYSRTLAYADPEELLKGNVPRFGNAPLMWPGVPVPEARGVQAPNFTRAISGGSSRIPEVPQDWVPGKDITAPSRIIDLKVTSTSYENETVTLEFTATGDDLDSGRASFYVIRASTSPSALRASYNSTPAVNDTDVLFGNLSSPRQFGERELFVLHVPVPTNRSVVSYSFGMHAVDDSGNEGDVSNVAQANLRRFIPREPTTPQPELSTKSPLTTNSPTRTSTAQLENTDTGHTTWTMTIANEFSTIITVNSDTNTADPHTEKTTAIATTTRGNAEVSRQNVIMIVAVVGIAFLVVSLGTLSLGTAWYCKNKRKSSVRANAHNNPVYVSDGSYP